MPSWLQSLESLARAITMLAYAGVGFALLAALCGAAALYLNRQADGLRDERRQGETAALEQAHRTEMQEMQRQVDESLELLVASEERSEGFLDRIESLQQELESDRGPATRTRRAQPPPARPAPARPESPPQAPAAVLQAAPETEATPGGALSAGQLEKIRNALKGKPTGDITLVAVVGQESSALRTSQLQTLLTQLGWDVTVIQGVFPSPPAECSFVVHGPDSVPETASSLSVALAMVDLMSLPIKVVINAQRPPGFLGLIVAPG